MRSEPGPDGNTHDTLAPSDTVMHPGQEVTVKVIDCHDMPRSITAPELALTRP